MIIANILLYLCMGKIINILDLYDLLLFDCYIISGEYYISIETVGKVVTYKCKKITDFLFLVENKYARQKRTNKKDIDRKWLKYIFRQY